MMMYADNAICNHLAADFYSGSEGIARVSEY